MNAIPVLEIPQTLGWKLNFRFTDHVSPVLLLLYKAAVIGPVIATARLTWQGRRAGRRGRRGPDSPVDLAGREGAPGDAA